VQEGASRIVLETELAGERLLDDLEEDPLPRIC
jgi:hydrogenase expression/formation protein HypE